MKNVKRKVLILLLLLSGILLLTQNVYADTQSSINSGINYLGTQLNGATGQIQGGSTGDASPWAAIAFSANGIDPSTVKTSTNAPSLVDYLQSNPPTASSPATNWEKWILAIVASGKDPTNFGGINYVSTLESTYYNNSQLGDTSSETDDWFGVMALIASGIDKSDPVLLNSLTFILAHQNSDGGFGYSTDPSVGSDGNDTAAAIQALVDAKMYGVDNSLLDCAISSAKAYLLTTQDSSGGFLYDTNPWTTSPDTDSTTWALMALNTLGMKNSIEANKAINWLTISPQQSQSDGGFTACNSWDPATFACTGVASNSTTTSHGLISLSGKGWVIKGQPLSSDLSCNQITPTPTLSPTPTDTPTPTSSSSVSNSSPTPTPTPVSNTVITTPTPTPNRAVFQHITSTLLAQPNPTPTSIVSPVPTITQEVLGTSTTATNKVSLFFFWGFLGIGIGSFGLWGFGKLKG